MMASPSTSTIHLLMFILLLTGCTRYAWTKADANQEEMSRDNYTCLKEATTAVGPIPSAGGSVTLREAGRPDSGVRGMLQLQQQKEASESQQAPLKQHEENLQNLYRACMESKGYRWQPQP